MKLIAFIKTVLQGDLCIVLIHPVKNGSVMIGLTFDMIVSSSAVFFNAERGIRQSFLAFVFV